MGRYEGCVYYTKDNVPVVNNDDNDGKIVESKNIIFIYFCF